MVDKENNTIEGYLQDSFWKKKGKKLKGAIDFL